MTLKVFNSYRFTRNNDYANVPVLRYRHIAYLVGIHYVTYSTNGRAFIRFSFVIGFPGKSWLEITVEIFQRTGKY